MAITVRTFVSIQPHQEELFVVLLHEGMAWDVGEMEEVEQLIADLEDACQRLRPYRAEHLCLEEGARDAPTDIRPQWRGATAQSSAREAGRWQQSSRAWTWTLPRL